MVKVVTPVTAQVEVIDKLKESSYQAGQYYRSVLFLDLSQPAGSEESKIWKSLSESESEGLVKGATVQLVPAGKDKNGNDKHNVVLIDIKISAAALSSTTTEPPAVGWTPEQKREIANRVQQNADLLAYCLQVAQTKFGDLVASEESIRCLATTIYLSVNK